MLTSRRPVVAAVRADGWAISSFRYLTSSRGAYRILPSGRNLPIRPAVNFYQNTFEILCPF